MSPSSSPTGQHENEHQTKRPQRKLRLYSKLDARFDDSDEDPRASLVNLVDVMLVFACGLMAALAASGKAQLTPTMVEKGQEIERPASGTGLQGAGYSRVGEVFRDPKSGKLILIEPEAGKSVESPAKASKPSTP